MTSISEIDLQVLHSDKGYRQHFMDLEFWRPYVIYVCQRDQLSSNPTIRIGLVGTCPTFIVDNKWIIKFFGRNFDGDTSYQTEFEVNRLVTEAGVIPAPPLLRADELFPDASDWPWPFLITEFVAGTSIGEVYAQVLDDDKRAVPTGLGRSAKPCITCRLRLRDCRFWSGMPTIDSLKINMSA